MKELWVIAVLDECNIKEIVAVCKKERMYNTLLIHYTDNGKNFPTDGVDIEPMFKLPEDKDNEFIRCSCSKDRHGITYQVSKVKAYL